MADEQDITTEQESDSQAQAEQPEQQETANGTDPETTEAPEKVFTSAQVEEMIRDRLERQERKAAQAAEKAAEEAKRKAAEEQGEFKTLYEDTQAQLAEAQKQLAEMERASMRREAVDQTGLPAALADRLQGETLDEMVEDAKTLLAAMPKQQPATNINGTARGTTKAVPSDHEIQEQAAVLGVDWKLLKQQYVGG
jgi:hypothetical protein